MNRIQQLGQQIFQTGKRVPSSSRGTATRGEGVQPDPMRPQAHVEGEPASSSVPLAGTCTEPPGEGSALGDEVPRPRSPIGGREPTFDDERSNVASPHSGRSTETEGRSGEGGFPPGDRQPSSGGGGGQTDLSGASATGRVRPAPATMGARSAPTTPTSLGRAQHVVGDPVVDVPTSPGEGHIAASQVTTATQEIGEARLLALLLALWRGGPQPASGLSHWIIPVARPLEPAEHEQVKRVIARALSGKRGEALIVADPAPSLVGRTSNSQHSIYRLSAAGGRYLINHHPNQGCDFFGRTPRDFRASDHRVSPTWLHDAVNSTLAALHAANGMTVVLDMELRRELGGALNERVPDHLVEIEPGIFLIYEIENRHKSKQDFHREVDLIAQVLTEGSANVAGLRVEAAAVVQVKQPKREHIDTLLQAISRRIAVPVKLSVTYAEVSDYGRIISLDYNDSIIEPSLEGRRVITSEIAETFARISVHHRDMLDQFRLGAAVDFDGEYVVGEFRSGPFQGTLEARLLPSGEKLFLLDLLWKGVPARSAINLGDASNVVDLEQPIINSMEWGSPRGASAAVETFNQLTEERMYPKPFSKLFLWARRTRRLSF